MDLQNISRVKEIRIRGESEIDRVNKNLAIGWVLITPPQVQSQNVVYCLGWPEKLGIDALRNAEHMSWDEIREEIKRRKQTP